MGDHPVLIAFPPSRALPGSLHDTQHPPLQSTPKEKCIAERVLHMLSTGLEPKSYACPLPPTLLFAICDILRNNGECVSGHSLLPLVLSKLRPWRLLDQENRCTPDALRSLASELADIRSDPSPPSHPTEVMHAPVCLPALNVALPCTMVNEMVSDENTTLLDPELLGQGENIPWPSLGDSPCASVLSLSRRNHLKLSTSHHWSHRRISSSEYRSGCAACCRPRDSSSSTPRTPLLPLAEIQSSLPRTQGETDGLLLRRQSKPSQTPSVPSRRKPNHSSSSASSLRKEKIDENMSPLSLKRNGVNSSVALPRTNTPSKLSSLRSRPAPSPTPVRRVLDHSPALNRTINIHPTRSVYRRTNVQSNYQSKMQEFSHIQGSDELKGKCVAPAKLAGRRHSLGIVPDLSHNGPGLRSRPGFGRKDTACSTARAASIDMGYLQRRLHKGQSIVHD
ncbi:hypothetical protein SCLCIDRAFT_30974 [Scleroderma citrinum Foug A]|uniref:Uncharacterized protein n=1 Tax=Scleroderma citrinum Foug A TaxID=1036808 RepID=A0A0C2ZPW8_9AGAM|nr:hypothetical protein SCLCIDRAFT_30974 [Scleroderma citrinum Foug A]